MTRSLLLNSTYQILEFTTQGLYSTDNAIFPLLFVTIVYGAISGVHASQSPIVARCIKNENDARHIFFGAMVLERLTALFWAAIALAFFHEQSQLAVIYATTPSVVANDMVTALLEPIGVFLAII